MGDFECAALFDVFDIGLSIDRSESISEPETVAEVASSLSSAYSAPEASFKSNGRGNVALSRKLAPKPVPSASNSGSMSEESSPASCLSMATRDSTTETPQAESASRKRKRERNTEAARRYRQRRLDDLTDLQEALAAMTKERDDLRVKLIKTETEAEILRGLVKKSCLDR